MRVRYRAYAKINLCLEVLGRRRDGYHQVATVLQNIGLYDLLTFEPAEEISLTVRGRPDLEGPENLVWRAAELLREATGCPLGVRIEVDKGIPVAAGLGGGSSDAAATLVALNRLWGLEVPPAALRQLALRLGSDVPFFLPGGTAYAAGRGEEVEPLPPLPRHWVVLVFPELGEIPEKTKTLYWGLEGRDYTQGFLARRLAERLRRREPLEPSFLYNAFERIAFQRYPPIEEARRQVVAAGGDRVRLSGSGPTLFVLYAEELKARTLFERLQEMGVRAALIPTVERGWEEEGEVVA